MKFIDLFSGIGGFRIGFENNGFECIFSCEINKDCRSVYSENFNEEPFIDVTKIIPKELPDFDILCAGFPCQPFIISGKGLGFEDIRGTLFFDICHIIKIKKPSVVVLENVKNLIYHDDKKTFKKIISVLEEMHYKVSFELLNAKDFNIPQNRERIIIVATLKEKEFDFKKIKKKESKNLADFLDKENNNIINEKEYTLINKDLVKKQKSGLVFVGYMNKNIRKNGVKEGTLHLSRVHRQTNRIYSSQGYHPTLSSQEISGRYYIYIEDSNIVRKMSINECYRIMGFPENFKKSQIKANQYKQIGNSVCIPMISAIAEEIKNQYY